MGLMFGNYISYFICLSRPILHRGNFISQVAISPVLAVDCFTQWRNVCIFLEVDTRNGPDK